MVRTLALAIGLGAFLVMGTAHAGVPWDALCKEQKTKAAGKKGFDLLKAFGKNMKKTDDARLASDISKAESKFTKGFSKAESKGACVTTADSDAIETELNAFVSYVLANLETGCGNNMVNDGEECDGTEDSACPGRCMPPGGGGGCGDNVLNGAEECRCATEQCDGTQAPQCPGLCLANCTCPEPICNNGVKESGEECDPAGSTSDCSPGKICGGFCTCVSDVACNCGSPDPNLYLFTGKAPTQPSCGATDGGPPIDSLQCGGLYIGGGGGALPVANMTPDEYVSTWSVAQCKGSDLTLTHTTQAQAGVLHCTEGKKCVGGTNAGEPCVRDHECAGGTCTANCLFGSPMSMLNLWSLAVSTCAINEIAGDSTGGANCATGQSLIRYPIDTALYLTGSDQSASTPGHNPCPICVGGTLNVPNSGHCEGGPNGSRCSSCPGCPFIQCGDDSDCPPPRTCDIRPCMPQSTPYDVHNCCAGGANASRPCSDNSDCPSSTCISDCSLYPTSHDCPPNPMTKVGGIILALDLTADTSSKTADANGDFCGWCRDIEAEGSFCFEGNPDEAPAGGAQGCPDSAVMACRPATYHGAGGGDPADIAECGDPLPCRTDADCTAPYETCTQRNPGAWRDETTRNITYTGTRPGSLTDHLPHPGTVVSAFCIPPTFDPANDGQADLGGPGGLSLRVETELSP